MKSMISIDRDSIVMENESRAAIRDALWGVCPPWPRRVRLPSSARQFLARAPRKKPSRGTHTIMDVPVAANVLGTIGAVCWSIQLLPQIIINYRRHDTEGLQPSMMLLWAAAGVPLGVYNIVEEFNVALRIQPQILIALSLLTWAQCLYYGKKYTIPKCIAAVVPLLAGLGGVEVGLVFALKAARDRDLSWPLTLMAVLSACLLAAGVLTHYWDIYVHRTVRGISFLFVGIDAAGDLFSLVSILFEPSIDVLGMVIYGTELALWIGVFVCGGVFNLRPWIQSRTKKRNEQVQEPVSLHVMPSSTSVFRTASGSDVVTRRPRTHVSES